MKVLLTFDFERYLIYIPDGYIHSISELKTKFLDWVEGQQECTTCGYGYFYNHNTFLKYLNNVVLNEVNEKAYLLKNVCVNSSTHAIHF